MSFREQIEEAKKSNVEFENMNDAEQLEKRKFASKAAYLLANLCSARENVYRECGFKGNEIRNVGKLSEKMKKELAFIAAVCEELLNDEAI